MRAQLKGHANVKKRVLDGGKKHSKSGITPYILVISNEIHCHLTALSQLVRLHTVGGGRMNEYGALVE
jgi:hypothetical protein